MMKKWLIGSIWSLAAGAACGVVPTLNDNFESLYVEGQTFEVATNGWQASGSGAYVTNSGGYTNSRAVFMGEFVVLTNTLNADPALKVWTDFRIRPTRGKELPATNASSFQCCFDTNGIVYVATTSGWHACTNDVWGQAVAPVTGSDYVRLSVFQDYATSNQAVFLDDQLLVQDVGFVGQAPAYSQLEIQNTDSQCWLDNVWVSTNVTGLASNRNGDALGDADELQLYGYARRTLYVCQSATNKVPLYANLQDAVNAFRLRDEIHVVAGSYTDNLTLTQNIAFVGSSFAMGALTVSADASISFAQGVACGQLAVSGEVTLAQSASLTSATAHVEGTVRLASNAAFVVSGALSVTGAGRLDFTNAQLVASAAGLVMTGTFAISNTWGAASLVGMALPFSDTFDLYGENTALTTLLFRGWNASDGGVKVQHATAYAGGAVVLPDGAVLSNSITAVAATKIWTDYYIRPSLGVEPPELPGPSSFLAYVNTNGQLVVATANSQWTVCSNQLDNTPATVISSNTFTRVTVYQDLAAQRFAVFVASNLVAQGLSLPSVTSQYVSFEADNVGSRGTAYVDEVLITTALPLGLTSDLDLDGVADAYEIHNYGLTSQPSGTVYTFR